MLAMIVSAALAAAPWQADGQLAQAVNLEINTKHDCFMVYDQLRTAVPPPSRDLEIQDLADFVGDSLALAHQAAKTQADVIVFCGVHFMAETAKILNPHKLVLMPDAEAGCSLASGCPAGPFQKFIEAHPGHQVVSYINCSAAVKALSDVIVTSSNAVKIVRQLPADRPIIFAYHGYPWLIHRLTYRRRNHPNLHVRGYKEEGTTTTPFDMVMLNDLDRYHLVMDVIDRVPGLGARAAGLRQEMADRRVASRAYTRAFGEDAPEVRDWAWPGTTGDSAIV